MRIVCAGRKAVFAAGFLLQRGGGEGRLRIAPGRLGIDRGHGVAGASSAFLKSSAPRAGADVEALDLLAVGADQTGLESIPARRQQGRDQRPVFARDELLDLELAIADQPQRHRLHAAAERAPGSLRHSTGEG